MVFIVTGSRIVQLVKVQDLTTEKVGLYSCKHYFSEFCHLLGRYAV
jgi:hypothetical protein